METNEIITKEKLKTYFETGKYPTEHQFAELIDFLSIRDGVQSNKEMVTLANNLASLDNGYILYSTISIENGKFPILVRSKEGEEQIFTVSNTGKEEKRFFQGEAPYSVRTKEFQVEKLEGNRYYYLYSLIDDSYATNRLFGNNLPGIPEGMDLGTVENKKLYIQISNQDFDRKINNLHTRFTLVNKTDVLIQYALYGNYWSNRYTSEDMVTDHYDLGDSLACFYKADLRGVDKSIACRLYDEDNGTLLMTAYLLPNQKNQNVMAGGLINRVRNVRIECDYENLAK
ncbi:hypothetical protein [Chryseobacterium cheonjiense]|uniref:Uncharacterized protein n=1 Tax=Chryseobacterium cheonjiense TaxID=2728845 RepID=A0A7Y0A6P8_9FLAO|nr:hypothetical protein [Chryseobacterium cheonjiense]NML57692.1 hypothetical protein [Chryseobacterium cheonjiense]